MKADYRTAQNRINELWLALNVKAKEPESAIVARYAKLWHLSERQMYRYLQEARQVSLPGPVMPEDHSPKQPFSVRLSESILKRLRAVSEAINEPMSVIIENALDSRLRAVEDFQREAEEAARKKPLSKRRKASSQR